MNGMERRPARRTLADVAVCRSMIRSMSMGGTPIPRMAFQSVFLSTESKAAFRSTNGTCNGCWNSILYICMPQKNYYTVSTSTDEPVSAFPRSLRNRILQHQDLGHQLRQLRQIQRIRQTLRHQTNYSSLEVHQIRG